MSRVTQKPSAEKCTMFAGKVSMRQTFLGSLELSGKCEKCNKSFQDHSFYKKITKEDKKAILKHIARHGGSLPPYLLAREKDQDESSPIYADLTPTNCRCGKIISHTENPTRKEAFCGDNDCFMKNYYVTPKNADVTDSGIQLPPLNATKLMNTRFCSCGNICKYNLEQNVYEDTCRHCGVNEFCKHGQREQRTIPNNYIAAK